MGLLTPKGKKDDKKPSKNNNQQSKFIPKANLSKGASSVNKKMTGGSQRGS